VRNQKLAPRSARNTTTGSGQEVGAYYIEQNFGLKFALRALDPDRIREVTQNILDEKARVDRNTAPQSQASGASQSKTTVR
jgi:uncharacterized protein (TIGR04141 family)